MELVPAAIRNQFDLENNYNIRGLIYLALGRNQEALKDFETALSIKRDVAYIYVNRAVALTSISNSISLKAVNMQLNYSAPGNFSNAVMTFPVGAKIKSDINLQSALNDCATAIQLPKNAYAWYVSAHLKYYLKKPDYCTDMFKAKGLGMTGTEEFIAVYCR